MRRMLWLAAGVVVAVAIGVAVDRAFFAGGSSSARPELQSVLDGLVRSGTAPGVTAYVSSRNGDWAGSAGVADVGSNTPMTPDARLRIESNSKTWLAALILQLAQQRKLGLDDTVDRWLPGLLRSYGPMITIRELLHDSSGLIDDNDVYRATPQQLQAMLDRVKDAKLRAQLLAMGARLRANPSAQVPAKLFIELAAWQPLVATPNTVYHHSNIGWNVAGLVAAKAGGKPLPTLYEERLFRPLQLEHTAFSPQGPIPGPHANGYARDADGALVDMTASHPGKFSDGAIVTSAQDEATFLRALMTGKLFAKRWWRDLYGTPAAPTCETLAWDGEGAGNGYRSYVRFSDAGAPIAVLLLNSDRADTSDAARRLYCAA